MCMISFSCDMFGVDKALVSAADGGRQCYLVWCCVLAIGLLGVGCILYEWYFLGVCLVFVANGEH